MRLYLEHRRRYLEYREAQGRLNSIANELEQIEQKVQPRSTLSEHEREHMPTSPRAQGTPINKAEEYVIALEQSGVYERMRCAKEILEIKTILLEQKEAELRKSRDIYNWVYCLRWVDGMKTDAIIRETGYSRSQVHNILKHLSKQLER
jgi:hypothetical protein